MSIRSARRLSRQSIERIGPSDTPIHQKSRQLNEQRLTNGSEQTQGAAIIRLARINPLANKRCLVRPRASIRRRDRTQSPDAALEAFAWIAGKRRAGFKVILRKHQGRVAGILGEGGRAGGQAETNRVGFGGEQRD